MTADVLLTKLFAVRQVAPGRWRARCPAHDGKNSNVLSVGETTDGTVLLKCFAGCTAADVVGAVGLELSDLFPNAGWQESGAHHSRPRRRPRVDWPVLVAACERDLILVKIILSDLALRQPVADADAVACQAAATRVLAVVTEARHG